MHIVKPILAGLIIFVFSLYIVPNAVKSTYTYNTMDINCMYILITTVAIMALTVFILLLDVTGYNMQRMMWYYIEMIKYRIKKILNWFSK